MSQGADPDRGSEGEPEQGRAENRLPSEEPSGDEWPEVDPDAIETKHFLVEDGSSGQVAVTLSRGKVGTRGAPSDVLARLLGRLGEAIQKVGHLVEPPVVRRADSFASMTVIFDEAVEEKDQTQIPYFPVRDSAAKIAKLLPLYGDELFAETLKLGDSAPAYVGLVEAVRAEEVTLTWEVRGEERQYLTAGRAASQYDRLSRPAELRTRPMEIEGQLYRVIHESSAHGRAGIKLAKGSPVPPRHKGAVAIVEYDTEEVANLIIHELIGEPVIAMLEVTEPAPMTSVLPREVPFARVLHIRRGSSFTPMQLGEEDLEEEGDF